MASISTPSSSTQQTPTQQSLEKTLADAMAELEEMDSDDDIKINEDDPMLTLDEITGHFEKMTNLCDEKERQLLGKLGALSEQSEEINRHRLVVAKHCCNKLGETARIAKETERRFFKENGKVKELNHRLAKLTKQEEDFLHQDLERKERLMKETKEKEKREIQLSELRNKYKELNAREQSQMPIHEYIRKVLMSVSNIVLHPPKEDAQQNLRHTRMVGSSSAPSVSRKIEGFVCKEEDADVLPFSYDPSVDKPEDYVKNTWHLINS